MKKRINPGVHPSQSLNPCNDKSPIQESWNEDLPPNCDSPHSQREKVSEKLSWLTSECQENTGLGFSGLCDPMQTGQILNDPENPDRNHIYRYTKAKRGCDEAMLDLFSNLVVQDINGEYHPVPIMPGSQERAVAVILQENVRKDNSLVIDRPILPYMSLYESGVEPDLKRYVYHGAINWLRDNSGKPGFTTNERYERDTVYGKARGLPINIKYVLTVWTLYIEEMNQILEQILLKFSSVAYINVRGIDWETIVKLDSTANNLNVEPGEKSRIIKYQFNMTVEAYIPQPITRKKAVLKQKLSFANAVEKEDIMEVLGRIEVAVKELEK